MTLLLSAEVDRAVAVCQGGVSCLAGHQSFAAGRGACSTCASWSTPTARRSLRSSRGSTARCSGDALGEVARGLENIEFACGIPNLLKGGYSEQASTGIDVYSIKQPLGVVAGITPFNFPGMVPMWMFANALGVRQHVHPQAEREGSVGEHVHRRTAEAGRPARRLLQRRQRRQGGRRPHPRAPRHRRGQLRRLHTDRQVHLRDRHPNGKRVQALGGAKNHMLVLPDADLDMAADAAVSAGLRLGRRAVHGHLRRARQRRRSPTRWSTRSRSASRRSRSVRPASPRARWAR